MVGSPTQGQGTVQAARRSQLELAKEREAEGCGREGVGFGWKKQHVPSFRNS